MAELQHEAALQPTPIPVMGARGELRSLPRGRTWILIAADALALALALAITYSVAEALASPRSSRRSG